MISIKNKKKAKIMAAASVLGILLVICACLVIGFAISDGWEAVFAWFTSKWAVLVIVFAVVVAIVFVYGFFSYRDKEDFK